MYVLPLKDAWTSISSHFLSRHFSAGGAGVPRFWRKPPEYVLKDVRVVEFAALLCDIYLAATAKSLLKTPRPSPHRGGRFAATVCQLMGFLELDPALSPPTHSTIGCYWRFVSGTVFHLCSSHCTY